MGKTRSRLVQRKNEKIKVETEKKASWVAFSPSPRMGERENDKNAP